MAYGFNENKMKAKLKRKTYHQQFGIPSNSVKYVDIETDIPSLDNVVGIIGCHYYGDFQTLEVRIVSYQLKEKDGNVVVHVGIENITNGGYTGSVYFDITYFGE